jgi:hypothetical protein
MVHRGRNQSTPFFEEQQTKAPAQGVVVSGDADRRDRLRPSSPFSWPCRVENFLFFAANIALVAQMRLDQLAWHGQSLLGFFYNNGLNGKVSL